MGPEAEERARRAMAAERRGMDAYAFERHDLALPWGGSTKVIAGDFRS